MTGKQHLFFVSVAAIAFIGGCVSGPDDIIVLPPSEVYLTKVAQGWLEFESGRYQDAITAFSEASAMDPSQSDAYLGSGWTYAMIDDLDSSMANFALAITKAPEAPDGYAAKAFLHLAQNQHEDAIAAADKAISLGGEEYVFSQVPDVQTQNLRLLIAECYYAMGKYEDAQKQVDILKPDNDLDPNSRSYKRDLLLEIEGLKPVGSVLEELSN